MSDEHQKPVSIVVNEKPVSLPDHKATGKQIKQAAIEQGVAIKIEFNLFRLTGHAQHPVGDTETVTLHDGERFRAVAADDNS